ncbi:hypothetical protein [Sphingomonas sp. PP-F2F-G114-C0414]|uniref:hypothetical protein n=1 Tax=Sphingomonas sp. PP-F2F-G114-C0414 TaxID=2135662 RepID=UPI00217E7D3E|nr:hypothetical protein [Sphingomonas sp. PP-F2F-G114-C0414]
MAIFLLLAVAVVYAPQLLAFPHEQRIGTVTVYAERPIDPRIGSKLARAEGLLRASPIYTGPLDRSLFLTDGGWRWRLLAIQSPGAFAFRRPFSSAIVFNRSDIPADRVTNGRAIGGIRTLSGVIAHESTHIMIANHLGEVRSAMLPTWQQEGYADHVALESSLTDAEAARLRKTDPAATALVYYDARRRVAAALSAKRGSVDAFFAGG